MFVKRKYINRKGKITLLMIMVFLMFLSIIAGFYIPEIHHGGSHISKNQRLKNNTREINKSLQNYFADHGYYPVKLKDLTTCQHPYFEEIPVNPESGQADWLVTNKTNYINGRKYFAQNEFHLFDINKEGIYKVKANKSNVAKFQELLAKKHKLESRQFNKILLIIIINIFIQIILYSRKKHHDRRR